jgi:hypothetical protein
MMLEDGIQAEIVKVLTSYKDAGLLEFYAVPNGGKRHIGTAVKLKKTGLRKGVPDLVVLFRGGRSAYIEVKSPKGRIDPEQRKWAEWLKDAGYYHAYVRSVQDVQSILDEVVNEPLREAA